MIATLYAKAFDTIPNRKIESPDKVICSKSLKDLILNHLNTITEYDYKNEKLNYLSLGEAQNKRRQVYRIFNDFIWEILIIFFEKEIYPIITEKNIYSSILHSDKPDFLFITPSECDFQSIKELAYGIHNIQKRMVIRQINEKTTSAEIDEAYSDIMLMIAKKKGLTNQQAQFNVNVVIYIYFIITIDIIYI